MIKTYVKKNKVDKIIDIGKKLIRKQRKTDYSTMKKYTDLEGLDTNEEEL